ncbi:MAG TPA: bifunctional phosphoribosylaminoimidazolecarboxamide formyltransferase/IMP cyclohydrolase [Tepidisphaeraceae bacterium]|nr:bifunctional phosphoribosylaminoimidazolecarboxamide formyltransferase/IMP cyclohydrolase [Tepidisphaeraceae bacterium]
MSTQSTAASPSVSDLVPVRRALLSVSDKTGLADFAKALACEFGVELISTGGTAKFLRDLGLKVIDVSELTGFPEMMDGRVKTLHPTVHGGLLALRDNPEHVAAMQKHGIGAIDLVCVNLYPFEQTIRKPGCTFEHAIENIDIGGPSMIRSASKNHRFVTVVTSPLRYDHVLHDLRTHNGSTSGAHRLQQAQFAFAHTAEYDSMIANYLATAGGIDSGSMVLHLHKALDLRYGENPHQKAALLVDRQPDEASVAFARQLHGKALSYINLLDADAALACVKEFDPPAACIVKHATPCGVAIGMSVADAFEHAYASDPLAAFGGIVAVNLPIDLAAANAIVSGQKFLEVIVAPSFDDDALKLLQERWKNVRLLAVGPVLGGDGTARIDPSEIQFHKITGGMLMQQRDLSREPREKWQTVASKAPDAGQLRDLEIAWKVCKHVKSNAIVLVRDGATVGIGGGQVDRVGAAGIAISKAGDRARGPAAASDAFFPFADGPKRLLDAGVTAIIQPGGSVRDGETIDAINTAGATMVFTGVRHFRH